MVLDIVWCTTGINVRGMNSINLLAVDHNL